MASALRGGVVRLFDELEVECNSQVVAPSLFLDANQATLGGWPCKCKPTNVATLTGTGDSPDVGLEGPNPGDAAVLLKAAKFWEMNPAPDDTQVALEDLALHAIVWPNQASDYIIGKVSSAGPGDGYLLYFSGTSQFSAWIKTNGLASRSHNAAPAWSLGRYADVWMFFDNSDGTIALRIYIDGEDGGVGFGWGLGSLTNDGPFQIGNGSQLSDNPFAGGIVAARLYKKTDWFPGGSSNTTVWQATAREQHALLAGAIADANHATAYPVSF
jgi:hypothetical protein